jgi:DNA repair exonuclease SbcCD nuclease subunit
MSRIWLLSDTHLGCRSNSVLWLSIIEDYFFNFFIPLVKKEYKKGDILFHLGDVFDNRQSLNLAAQDLGIRVFEELSKIFPEVHIIVGNHDIMKKNSNDITSVDCLKYIPNVTVHKEPKILEYSGVKCLLMPWRRDSVHEKETLESIKENIDYVFCHTETQGVQTTASTKHLHDGGNSLDTFKRFKRVYSGHIHYRQEKENFILLGNPYQMTRSDRGNQKGVYVLDLLSGNHKFIKNKRSPIFIRYYINDILERRMEDILKEIKGNFVDVYIPSKVLGKYNINKFMDFLDGHAKKLEPRIYDEENPIETDDDMQASDFTGELNLMNISTEFINGLNYDEEFKERLINSISELYKQALTPTHEDYYED